MEYCTIGSTDGLWHIAYSNAIALNIDGLTLPRYKMFEPLSHSVIQEWRAGTRPRPHFDLVGKNLLKEEDDLSSTVIGFWAHAWSA